VENDLFIGVPGGGKARRITNDGTDGIVNGHSVHRQEYGITKGTFWSPQGSRLAFYRMDETMVTKYQLEDITTTPSTFDGIRYPMAGATSHHVTVGVHDLKTGNTIFLKTGEPLDQYLTNISWSVDERYVHVVHLDRKTENLELVRYDASTGERVATLHREHDDRYLEPQHPAHFLKTRPDEYLWRSDKDGWPHYHLLAKPEGEARQLTRGPWVPKELIGIDPKEGYMVISGTAKIDGAMPTGATETHVYRVELPSGKTTRLTNEPGTHYGQLSTSGRYLIDQWSSTSVPGRTVIRDASTGKVVSTLIESTDPMKGRTVGTIELLAIKGENNDLLNARLIKPSTFDPAKRYPVLIYVYNGPHVQLVSNSFLGGASPWMLEAAERGYLVWTVDGHGSAYRGADFERIIHRQLGIVEVKDQMRGVEYLKGLAFVDPDRIAVHGWSFGGHMTTAMLLRNPGVFKVGVAGGPVMDWSLYEVMYTERYMDTPEENPEGYIATALPPAAAQLQEDLLLITGSQDDTVLPQHSLRFIQACVANGVQVDYFAYPGHGHNVRGKDRLHLMEKVLRHIDQFIVPER
jgi:dipeptidyl-peptidase-4